MKIIWTVIALYWIGLLWCVLTAIDSLEEDVEWKSSLTYKIWWVTGLIGAAIIWPVLLIAGMITEIRRQSKG